MKNIPSALPSGRGALYHHPAGAVSIRERFPAEETFFSSPYSGPMVDRSRKGHYGLAGDRLMALKGDRLTGRPADVVDEERSSLAKQQAINAAPADAAVGASAASEAEQPGLARPSANSPRYLLASAAGAAVVTPDRSAGKSAYPVLAPPQADEQTVEPPASSEAAAAA